MPSAAMTMLLVSRRPRPMRADNRPRKNRDTMEDAARAANRSPITPEEIRRSLPSTGS